MITIIDYGAGNIKSVANMLKTLGQDYVVTNKAEEILNAEKIIFPGQGHFAQSMQALKSTGMDKILKQVIAQGTPFLGICLGLQILFEKSEEAPGIEGLGVIKGEVKKFTQGKIPQIGWNKIQTTKNNSILCDEYYYFVNSFYVVPEDESVISSLTDYGIKFASSIEKDNLIAVQFHPEKSGTVGLETIKKWLQAF